ncbi:MAG: hypothetical protein IH846_14400 [Acidobacteria bacterium]|nr:hypothetical protein [Acidobacteriota bacterium]
MGELSTLIPWVLERIVNQEYRQMRDSKGQIKSVELDPDHGITPWQAIEKGLEAGLSDQNRAALFSLKDGYTLESLTSAMTTLFGEVAGPNIAERLAGATWEEIVTYVDGIFKIVWDGEGKWEGIGPRLARTREGFGTISDAKMEELVKSTQPESLRMYLEKKYARDLIKLFPNIVNRADSDLVRMLRSTLEPSDLVKRYLSEAVSCYIYGQFFGALFVCRAAIEASVEERLREKGYGPEVDGIKKDKLKSLIQIARDKRLLDRDAYEWADKVRWLANGTMHGNILPSEDEFRLCISRTRGVLEYLYSSQLNGPD